MLEFLESSLVRLVGLLKFALEAISVLCILMGLLASGSLLFSYLRRTRSFPYSEIQIRFGTWLTLALEFQLGADILATTITPTFQVLGQLAAIALIRTFLTYFLRKELEAEAELQKKDEKNN